jgi:hypothetical protein
MPIGTPRPTSGRAIPRTARKRQGRRSIRQGRRPLQTGSFAPAPAPGQAASTGGESRYARDRHPASPEKTPRPGPRLRPPGEPRHARDRQARPTPPNSRLVDAGGQRCPAIISLSLPARTSAALQSWIRRSEAFSRRSASAWRSRSLTSRTAQVTIVPEASLM